MTARPVRVLVVEDVAAIAALIRQALESEGLVVDVVGDLASANERVSVDPPDVMLLDVELPDGSGLQMLREGDQDQVPVVILSSRESELDRVMGLELGAEDYVVKPFLPRELASRVRKAATRSPRRPSPTRDFGDLVIDVASREVEVNGEPVTLTTREFDLLVHLTSAPRTVFSHNELLRDVWKSSAEWQKTSTVTEHVRRLRQKVESDPSRPRRILTVGRSGYRFEPGTINDSGDR